MNKQSENRICQNCKTDFTIDPEDFQFYEKMGNALPPVDCPDCRFKKRAVWRNEMCLYNRKCDATGENIISVYNPKSPYTVYSVKAYSSEDWDPRSFAMNYDSSKDFFEQFDELLKKVPKKALFPVLSIGANVNSDYVNFAGSCKDSYLCFNTAYVENVLYSKGVTNSRDSLDLYYNDSLEHCYESVNGYSNNHVTWDQNSRSCINCTLIEGCQNCSDCFGCVNLHNKSYCFFNEQLSKEEYKNKISEYVGNRSKMNEAIVQFIEHRKNFSHKVNQNINTVQCTGDYMFNSKNCHDCFEVGDSENSKYITAARKVKDSYDNIAGIGTEQCLENMSPNASSRLIGTALMDTSKDCLYSFGLKNCSDCIGCDGLENAQFCIFNKQYNQDEYEKLKTEIIAKLKEQGAYGHMLPSSLSPFGYNETAAQDNFPLTKEEALAQGFKWQDEVQITKGKQTLTQEQIPENINNVEDVLLSKILECESCQRNYRITAPELSLYKQIKVPIPTKCFFCRHKSRILKRGPYVLNNRSCDNCQTQVKSVSTIETTPIIYCEKCYQREVL